MSLLKRNDLLTEPEKKKRQNKQEKMGDGEEK